MENNTKLVFYIVREKSDDTTKDFSQFVYDLKGSFTQLQIVQDSPLLVTLSGHTEYQSQLEYLTADTVPAEFKNYAFCLKFTVGSQDYVTFGKLRSYLSYQRDLYRVFSHQFNSFLPQDIDFINLEFGTGNIKTFEILKKYSLTPVFYSQKDYHYYATDPTGVVHFVNPYLLEFIYALDIPESNLPELSYPVAKDINLFSALLDKDLIPTNYYQYYGRSTKIVNESYFDIDHQDRKVFIKPYIFEFKPETGIFYTYAGPEGGSLLLMDKIRPGENLDQSLKRVLSQELKIADDYIAALVSKKIEFDRDKEGLITPRLVVFVYIDHVKNKDYNLQLSQTGWKSVGGTVPTVKPNPDFKNTTHS